MTFAIDPIVLGHNPIFGVDHLSQEAGNLKAEQFADAQRIGEILSCCHALGVRGMMMSTHPRAALVCMVLDREAQLSSTWRVYPLVPYIQKYVRGANEKGLVTLVKDTLAQSSAAQKLSWLLRGGRGLFAKDIHRALKILIDLEMLPFEGRQLGAVFLHDALVDLALGLGIESVLEVFREHVEKRYHVPAGLVTKNLPTLRTRLETLGWSDTLVMASFNAIGFLVNPSVAECAAAIRKPGITFVAMSTLAAGALSPDNAYSFLSDYSSIGSVVVGMSRPEHVTETIAAIRRHLPFLAPAD